MKTNPQLIDLKTDVPLCYTRGPSSPPSSTHVLTRCSAAAAALDGAGGLVEFLRVEHVQVPAGETPFSSLCKHLINCLWKRRRLFFGPKLCLN